MTMFVSGVPILSLERYFKVLRNERRAKFLTCREFPADVNLNSDDKTLWQEHTRLMKAFNSSYASDDTEGTSFSSRHCHPSLLDLKVELSQRMLKSCNFCEHRCGVNRWEGELGHCRCGPFSPIASKFIHMYEEPELVPSFTIFFSGCNGGCIFCQNWDIANESDVGVIFKPQDLADIIMDHKSLDIRNVNWVGGDPTPHLHTVLKTLSFCKSNVASIWNSNMYLTEEAMALLAGTQDVYLTDFKFGNDDCAQRYSEMKRYWSVITRNHKLANDDAEVIIRHLVMPENIECCTKKILIWIRENLGGDARVNLMHQYRPEGKAGKMHEISRRLDIVEIGASKRLAHDIGLYNLV